jgi:hypothetical protein
MAREIVGANGALQRTNFVFINDRLGTVADAREGTRVTGVFRASESVIEIQYADGSSEILLTNLSGGISSEAKSATSDAYCTSYYPEGHVFSLGAQVRAGAICKAGSALATRRTRNLQPASMAAKAARRRQIPKPRRRSPRRPRKRVRSRRPQPRSGGSAAARRLPRACGCKRAAIHASGKTNRDEREFASAAPTRRTPRAGATAWIGRDQGTAGEARCQSTKPVEMRDRKCISWTPEPTRGTAKPCRRTRKWRHRSALRPA